MTTARHEPSGAVIDNYIYVLGGQNGSGGYLNSVERAAINSDATLGSWQTVSSMLTARRGLAATSSGGYLYALGGYDSHHNSLDSVERAAVNADGTLGAWQPASAMNHRRAGLGAVSVRGYLYALGGYDNQSSLNIVERAMINTDGSLGSWQIMNAMSKTRNDVATATVGGYIYALGGYGTGLLTTVEWTPISPASLNSLSPSAASSNQPTTITINGTNLLPTPTLQLGGATTLTTSFVSTTTLTTTVPSGLTSGWYTATLTNGDGHVATLTNALRVDGTGPAAGGLTINGGALNSS